MVRTAEASRLRKPSSSSVLFTPLLRTYLAQGRRDLPVCAEVAMHRLVSRDFGVFVSMAESEATSVFSLFRLLYRKNDPDEGDAAMLAERPVVSVDRFLASAKGMRELLLNGSESLKEGDSKVSSLVNQFLHLAEDKRTTLEKMSEHFAVAYSDVDARQVRAGLLLFHLTHAAIKMNEERLLEREICLVEKEASRAKEFVKIHSGMAILQQDYSIESQHPLCKAMAAFETKSSAEAKQLADKIPVRLEPRKQLVSELDMLSSGLMSSKNVADLLRSDDGERIANSRRSLVRFLREFESKFPSHRDVFECLAFAVFAVIDGVELEVRRRRAATATETVAWRDRLAELEEFLDARPSVCGISQNGEEELNSLRAMMLPSPGEATADLNLTRALLGEKSFRYTFLAAEMEATDRESEVFQNLLRMGNVDRGATFLAMYRKVMEMENADLLTETQVSIRGNSGYTM